MGMRKLFAGLTISVMLLFAGAHTALAVQSQNVAVSKVTATTAVVVVKADVASNVRIDYGPSPGVYPATKTSNGLIRHEILLDALTASSTVYYRIIITDSANPTASITLPETSFHTARAGGQAFSFGVAGDNRPASNIATPPVVWSTIIGQMAAENLDLSLHVGDAIYGLGTDTVTQNEAKYNGFFATTTPLTVSEPLYAVAGNHESIFTSINRAGFEREFALPVNNGPDASIYGEEYYSFDSGDTHFIALSTEIPGQEGLVTGNQMLWLQQDLAANTRHWTVVWLHRPLYGGTHAGDPWTDKANVAGQQNKAALSSLFSQYKVSMVFEGHEHFYQHHIEGGVNYIITGGGGAPLYPVPALGPGDIYAASLYEHVKVDESASSLNETAIDSAGSTLETFTLGTPDLRLDKTGTYWGSYADYVTRDLSVDYILSNVGGGDATSLNIVWLAATNSVQYLTSLPVTVGNLPVGASVATTVHYQVPEGITGFRATTYVTCGDLSGGTYSYPGPAPLL